MQQFRMTEWSIEINQSNRNPYRGEEMSLDMHIQSPGSGSLILPCYFDKKLSAEIGLWKARFTPKESGNYQYYFVLSQDGKISEKTKQETIFVSEGTADGFLVKATDQVLWFDSGKPFRGIGINLCWESRSTDDSKYFKELHEKEKYNYNHLLPLLKNSGGNFTRIWMCPWNLPLEAKIVSPNTSRYQNSEEYFNPSAIKRMDEVIKLADSLGIYIMLVLDQAGNYMGGQWETNNYNKKNGGHAADAREFFLNPDSRKQYKNRLRYLVARWGYSPSVAAWEFFNEADYLAFSGDKSDSINRIAVVDWHKEMSSYLKILDPYDHLVTTSISHMDVPGLNSIEHIDINQKHVYKYTAGIPDIIHSYSSKYSKPYVIGEFGYEWDWSKNFNDFAEGMDSDFKIGLWLGLFSSTPILPMSWWWEFFEDRGVFKNISPVKSVSDQMLADGNGNFTTIQSWTSDSTIRTMAIQCGQTKWFYLFNPTVEPRSTSLKAEGTGMEQGTIEIIQCETGIRKKMEHLTSVADQFTISNLIIPPKDGIIIRVSYMK